MPLTYMEHFLLQTEDIEANARDKLGKKNLDLIVANDVSAAGAGFAARTNRVLLLERGGARSEVQGSKLEVAHAIWDRIKKLL